MIGIAVPDQFVRTHGALAALQHPQITFLSLAGEPSHGSMSRNGVYALQPLHFTKFPLGVEYSYTPSPKHFFGYSAIRFHVLRLFKNTLCQLTAPLLHALR